MTEVKAHEEVIDFIAGGNTPEAVAAFKPSEAARVRVTELLAREKAEGLNAEEKSELDYYAQLEHLMRLARGRTWQFLTSSQVNGSHYKK